MAAENKQKKEFSQKLEADIKSALTVFAAGIESKKLDKKINRHSADLAELILKLKQPEKKEKVKAPKVKKTPKVKNAAAKPVKKVIPPIKKK